MADIASQYSSRYGSWGKNTRNSRMGRGLAEYSFLLDFSAGYALGIAQSMKREHAGEARFSALVS